MIEIDLNCWFKSIDLNQIHPVSVYTLLTTDCQCYCQSAKFWRYKTSPIWNERSYLHSGHWLQP